MMLSRVFESRGYSAKNDRVPYDGAIMSDGVNIFPMHRTDLAKVTELARQLGYNVTESEVSYRFDLLYEKPEHALFVAKKDQQVVGWVHVLAEGTNLLMSSRAEVHTLVVDEKYRSHGIGKRLLREAEKWAQQKSFKIIKLRSNVIREEAKKFYLREGYSVTKTQNTFEKSLS